MKQSPYFDINYGWPYGSDGWNIGMDENLLVLSFLDRHEVLGIVPTVPDEASEGDSYIVSSDNSARFFADGVWRIVYPSDGWTFHAKDTGLDWKYDNSTLVQRINPDSLAAEVQDLENRTSGIDSQISEINSQISLFEGIPQRVQQIEDSYVSLDDIGPIEEDIDTLEQTVSDLSGAVDNAVATMGGLQNSFAELRDEAEAKLSSVVAGSGISVDIADPVNPIVSLDTSVLSDVATSGQYSDLSGTPTLGTAASQDASAFDPSGASGAVEGSLTALINERMSAAARAAIDELDPDTATLSDLITALQS